MSLSAPVHPAVPALQAPHAYPPAPSPRVGPASAAPDSHPPSIQITGVPARPPRFDSVDADSSSQSPPSVRNRQGAGTGAGGGNGQGLPNWTAEDESATERLLVFTRAVPLPRRMETVSEWRFLLRLTQMLFAGGAFASLSTASFNVNYTSAVLGVSGINLMCFTSISSIFASIACLIVYCFPAFLGIPPHRHPRFSRVEVAIDFLFLGLWIAAPTVLVVYGQCPRHAFSTSPNSISCLPWNMCTAFGYAAVAAFLGTFTMGVRDLRKFGFFAQTASGTMFARGSWKEWADAK
ncbi:hypothetical protein BDK51DRAFT_27139 [Blyttiomyces helicus]|uniref:MARVEL domain-containing protein n=1 Tax=Blyttiomyces helicus TaxID=388810 RepID=A0A4P9WK11_9FUNG|nr:hypothetical protein BDK51DRAFT_27139 [Blyttiomyces helicus]|eukprot:RKO91878.1 hypothetical protein BDK51DRAFT_27139 [Blyttiomyces helicus]